MDLFEAFPQFETLAPSKLKEQSLRLIALSAIVFDKQAFYFELGAERFWARLPNGEASIGVGGARLQLDSPSPYHPHLAKHLRKQWRCEVKSMHAPHCYMLGVDKKTDALETKKGELPYMFIFTAPRLGGGPEVPDALTQAIYLLPVRQWHGKSRKVNLLRIKRDALDTFLDAPDWALSDLEEKPWADIWQSTKLPVSARVRPVLDLRGLRSLERPAEHDVYPFN